MKKILFSFLILLSFVNAPISVFAGTGPSAHAKEYYELRVYHFTTAQQVASLDAFFKDALLPALHKNGIKTVGVFKAVANDTAADKKIYVLIPHKSIEHFVQTNQKINSDAAFNTAASNYLNTPYDKPFFTRYETILLHAFDEMPSLSVPQLKTNKAERIYELRSYEGPTEKLYQNKVQMFNKGGEVTLFKKLGFNAVFYAEVLAGSHMPNLMYMTTFDNKAAREEHWKTFGSDPTWKTLSSLPEYQHNVSKADIMFLTPTDYSDL